MTRAKRSLAIISQQKNHPILQEVSETLLLRSITADRGKEILAGQRYQSIEPKDVDLSWAGRLPTSNPALRALSDLRTGNHVDLVEHDGRWMIKNAEGVFIGRIAKSYGNPPRG